MKWRKSMTLFDKNDPRHGIAKFFGDGDSRGPAGYLEEKCLEKRDDEETSEFFTVWRPTSNRAIKLMESGLGTGKSLNIKGKSAKQGKLSGYVPFLQIFENEHVKEVSTDSVNRVRIYYPTAELRNAAQGVFEPLMQEMIELETIARADIMKLMSGELELDQSGERKLDQHLILNMKDPRIELLDKPDIFGLEIPERLLWEAYVKKQDITRTGEFVTGRPSSVPFMVMNMHSIREKVHPDPVIYQLDIENAMNPVTLLMAYEEEKVRPVVSDFDPFLVASKNVTFEPLSQDQVECMARLIKTTQYILDNIHANENWTSAWLNAKEEQKTIYNEHEALVKVSSYGLGDPTTTNFIESCCHKLGEHGAVRHGAECFNYMFPQEIDDEDMLIVWSGLSDKTTPWKKVNRHELVQFLLDRVKDGFVFPPNPKWVLCDEGYYEIWQALHSTEESREKLRVWFPREAEVEEKIEAIRALHPLGFVSRVDMDQDEQESMIAMQELALKRKKTIRRAKFKLKLILIFLSIARKKNKTVKVDSLMSTTLTPDEVLKNELDKSDVTPEDNVTLLTSPTDEELALEVESDPKCCGFADF
uniref:Anthrax toxin edema factor central domain-containing protein n=1 Tax=Octactis speculum TaxID=3111310 RepID=A0A7S2DY20_9STRA